MRVCDLFAFLSKFKYGVVSSRSPPGDPQSALVGIAITPDLEVVFDTLKTSRKYRNLIAQPSCSFVIGWNGEQTVQLEGKAFEPEDTELKRYQDVYFATGPMGRRAWPGPVLRTSWLDRNGSATATTIEFRR